MRHGRAKQARRTLQFFERTCNIRSPFKVIIDGTFIVNALKFKLPLLERLETLLQHALFELYCMHSTLEELETIRESRKNDDNELFKESIVWLKQHCEVIMDGNSTPKHKNTSTTAAASILQHAPQTYLVASQDEEILDKLRSLGTVPIIRLQRAVLILEQPSKSANFIDQKVETRKWKSLVSEPEVQLVHLVKQQQQQKKKKQATRQQQQHDTSTRLKPKAKAPNPLSCKKRKQPVFAAAPKRKRRSRRKAPPPQPQTDMAAF